MQAKNKQLVVSFFNNLNLFKSLLLVGILALAFSVNAKKYKDKDEVVFKDVIYGVVKSDRTGRLWLDKNLGASQVCNFVTQPNCFGDLYQWGRAADGHQSRTSLAGTTLVLPRTLIPPTGAFIIGSLQGKYDWTRADPMGRDRANTWSDSICPESFRVPTEWEITLEGKLHEHGGVLNLPLAGKLAWDTGELTNIGVYGYLWTKSVFGSGTESSAFYFDYDKTKLNLFYRSQGLSIRCIQEE